MPENIDGNPFSTAVSEWLQIIQNRAFKEIFSFGKATNSHGAKLVEYGSGYKDIPTVCLSPSSPQVELLKMCEKAHGHLLNFR
jgi:hypothetical protein